jgi:hypothetical protein
MECGGLTPLLERGGLTPPFFSLEPISVLNQS